MLIQQKFGWPNKVFRLNMRQWNFLLIQQNIFLGVLRFFKLLVITKSSPPAGITYTVSKIHNNIIDKPLIPALIAALKKS